jgi:opacity protein-like surface antigen
MKLPEKILVAAVLAAGLLAAACASQGDASAGTHTLDAIVVERSAAPGSSGGSNPPGSGNYYLVFETREGQATARYRYEVTQEQWFRFPEGSRVRITLRNHILLSVRPND